MEIIESRLQPVDVAKVLGISREVFVKLPIPKQIYLTRLVYSGEFQNNTNNESHK